FKRAPLRHNFLFAVNICHSCMPPKNARIPPNRASDTICAGNIHDIALLNPATATIKYVTLTVSPPDSIDKANLLRICRRGKYHDDNMRSSPPMANSAPQMYSGAADISAT